MSDASGISDVRSETPTYPHLLWFERWFGTRVRTVPPNPLAVWTAELHDVCDGYAFRLLCTGVSKEDALDRLDKLIGEIRTNSAQRDAEREAGRWDV